MPPSVERIAHSRPSADESRRPYAPLARMMRRRGLALAMLAAGLAIAAGGAASSARAAQIQACFSPRLPGDCDPGAVIVAALNAARTSILVQAYEITAGPIVAALIDAHRRGVEVRVIVDYGQLNDRRYHYDARAVQNLRVAGIPVLVDRPRGIMHDKVMIIDGDTVITGSYNYTKRAERENVENLLVIHDPALAAQYARHWHSRASLATELSGAAGGSEMASQAGPIIGNRRTSIYQWPGCPYYGRISIRDRVEFPNAQAAEQAGYRPAKNCR